MFKLAGWDQKTAAAAAQTIMGIETKLAEASLDNVALRDPSATDHNTTFAQLQAMAPHIDWTAYFEHKQISTDVDMNVDQPKFMQEVDRQMQQTPLAGLESVFEVATIQFRREFAFGSLRGRELCLQRKIPGRHNRDEAAVETLRRIDRPVPGRGLGQKYVEKYFPPEAKARMQEMVRNLLAAMRDDILSRPG